MIFDKLKDKIVTFFNPKIITNIYYKLFFIVILGLLLVEYRPLLQEYKYLFISVRILFYYFLLNIIFNYARLLINYIYLKKNKYSIDYVDNFVLGIDRISFFLNHFVFFFVFIHLIGIDIKSLFTSLSIIAVAIVLIFKEYIANFLAGINIMFSDEYKLKDYVKIGEAKGRINNISFQNVELKTESGDYVFIPNALVLSKEVVNFSKGSIKTVKFETTLSSDYFDKFDNLRKLLKKKISDNFNEVQSIDNVNLKIEKIEKDTIIFSTEVYVSRYNYKIEEKIKSFASEEILVFLSKNKKAESKGNI